MNRRRQKHGRSGDLRKGRRSTPYGIYFITRCLLPGRTLSCRQREDIVEALYHFRYRYRGDLSMHAFVVMPDHWHLLISLGSSKSLGKLIECIEKRASYPSRSTGGNIDWEDEYRDHKIRPQQSVRDITRYIENNPGRKDKVHLPSEWRWSSAHAHHANNLDRHFLGHERWQD